MRIDIKKLDERIQKLQEIRRIAADPELSTILLEFVGTEDEVAAEPSVARAPLPDKGADTVLNSTRDVVKDVVNGGKPEAREGIWSRNR